MHAHPHFDLVLLDDDEIATRVGSSVVHRETVHEWPLSCVQRVRVASGRAFYVKSQTWPTVEPEFYRAVTAPCLLTPTAIEVPDRPSILLFEECPLPVATSSPAEDLVDRAMAAIGSLPQGCPTLDDLSSVEAWRAFWSSALRDLRELVVNGRFPSVHPERVRELERFLDDPQFGRVFAGEIGLVHGDLLRENVLAGGHELIILDWQRPILGPIDLDRAVLTESLGGDPLAVVSPAVLTLRTLRLIQWYTAAAVRWFPPGVGFFDRIVAEKVEGLQGAMP